MRWIGNIVRIVETTTHKRLLYAQLWQYIRSGLPKLRWLDFVTDEMANVGVNDWKMKDPKNREI
jgi:hypothetical protein